MTTTTDVNYHGCSDRGGDENNHAVDSNDGFVTNWDDDMQKSNEDKVESLRTLQSIVGLLQLWVNDDAGRVLSLLLSSSYYYYYYYSLPLMSSCHCCQYTYRHRLEATTFSTK